MIYSIGPIDYGLSFAKNISHNKWKNIDKNVSGKYNEIFFWDYKKICLTSIRNSFRKAIQSKIRSEWLFHS